MLSGDAAAIVQLRRQWPRYATSAAHLVASTHTPGEPPAPSPAPSLPSPSVLSLPLAVAGRRSVRGFQYLMREDRRGRLIGRYFYLFNDGLLYGVFAGAGTSAGASAELLAATRSHCL